MTDTNPDLATQAVETERAQIGHEIHDALLPLIFGAAAFLQSHLDGPAANHADRKKLAQAHDFLMQAQRLGRDLLVQIYPPELSDTVWTLAVQQTVASLLDDTTEVDWQFDDAAHSFDPAKAASLYRIIVEAISNASRHGKATKITVKVSDEACSILDNGCGFDPAAVPNTRFGIRSMKGRAALIDGTLEVDTRPGGPTTVQIKFATR